MTKKKKQSKDDFLVSEKNVKKSRFNFQVNTRITRSKSKINVESLENDVKTNDSNKITSKHFINTKKKNTNGINLIEKNQNIFTDEKNIQNEKNNINKKTKKIKSNEKIKSNNELKAVSIEKNESFFEKNLDNVKVEDLLQNFELKSNKNIEPKKNSIENSSDEDDDFEEVEQNLKIDNLLDDYNPDVCKEGVTIELFHAVKGRKKNPNWLNDMIRQNINRQRRNICINAHKVSLLAYLARCFYLNNLTKELEFFSLAFSLDILFNEKLKIVDINFLKNFLKEFKKIFQFKYEEKKSSLLTKKDFIINFFNKKTTVYPSIFTLTFLIILRAYFQINSIKINSRLCIAFQPISHKCENLLIKGSNKVISETNILKKKNDLLKKNDSLKKKNLLKNEPIETSFKSDLKTNLRSKRKSCNKSNYFSDNSEENLTDDDFISKNKKKSKKNVNKKESIINSEKLDSVYKFENNLKIAQSQMSNEFYGKDLKIEIWLEVYSDKESRWICIDPLNEILDNIKQIQKMFYVSTTYVLSFDLNNNLKDLTQKYLENYEYYNFKKERITDDWLDKTYSLFRSSKLSKLDFQEDQLLKEISLKRPLPKSFSDFKSHELYILEKHLLKYEVIYPPDTKPIGFFRGDKIFLRDNLKLVHSKEFWKREARSVKKNEEPYKISTARPKWDKYLNDYIKNMPLSLYGYWQTQDYEPGEAVDGKIPRNEFGNVDLYQPCMLPRGTVHLKLKGLMRIANKLQIDCVPAVTGFDLKNATTVPVLDGYVVCVEHKDILVEAWEKEQKIIEEREKDKYYKRVYGNYKRLVRAALISKKIYEKYKESFDA